jgi:dipeptidyl aminopeptidase/acylaminoacyl peptidase
MGKAGFYLVVFYWLVACLWSFPMAGSTGSVTVADAIAMRRLREHAFSRDRRKLVLVLSAGNVTQNTNKFSLLLFHRSGAFYSARPDLLLTFSSSSNKDAIHDLKWLNDDETIAFVGENLRELPEVYTLNVRTRHLVKRTDYPTPVISYDITRDGRDLAFVAEQPAKKIVATKEALRDGVFITTQGLDQIMARGCPLPTGEGDLFLQRRGEAPVPISSQDTFYPWGGPPQFSPDGRYALVSVYVRDVPKIWEEYHDKDLQTLIRAARRAVGAPLAVIKQYMLLDTKEKRLLPLLDVPVVGYAGISWSSDRQALLMKGTFLPLEAVAGDEREARRKARYDIELELPGRAFRKIVPESTGNRTEARPKLNVTIQQDTNTPPKVYISIASAHKEALLLDLNPQFGQLALGRVETIEWKVRGIDLLGGLYLPPDYISGKRYPLVIQTHGFEPSEFSMDGRSEWSSGFAARPLAAKGIVVLQAYSFKNQGDQHLVGEDRNLGATEEQAARNFAALAYENALAYLDERGVVDLDRVGISGFSRTACFVAYTLTHSRFKFAAASLVDGVDCGYFQYISRPSIAWDLEALNGGAMPFGEDGLKQWMKESPGFNLSRSVPPTWLEAHGASGGILSQWEWFAVLSILRQPVEYLYLPDAAHKLVKPSERIAAQQGLVDWFTFWLKGEEDPSPLKAEQYARWNALRQEAAGGDGARRSKQ